MARKFQMRNHKHFFNTVAPEHQKIVLPQLKTTEPEHNKIIVNYSFEGMCIFDVITNTPELLVVEFISTAS